jgi:alanyl-tRNA synthetase
LAENFLKPLGDNGIAVVTSGFEGKGSIVVAISQALSTSKNAADLVKAGVEALGGQGGGGRPNMAQGGGPNGTAGDSAIAAIKATL